MFKFIFKDKEKLLSLYNALNGTFYSNPDDIEITTLDDVIYCNMKNDVSFIIDARLSLYEHQSTLNRNMPLRGLLYFARNFEKYVESNRLNMYRSGLIKLPTPKFVIFYNGKDLKEDRMMLRLSDAFSNAKEEACMELEALVLNINYGKNKELMEKCRPLMEYSYFVKEVKFYSERMDRDAAINKAVDVCIKNNILKDVLIKNRAEVVEMLLTEYNLEKVMGLMEDEFAELKQQYSEEIKEMKQQYIREKTEIERQYVRERAEIEQQYVREKTEMKQQHEEETREMKQQHEEETREMKQQHEEETREMKQQHEEETREMKQQHEEETREMKQQYEEEMEQEKQKYQSELERMQKENQELLKILEALKKDKN